MPLGKDVHSERAEQLLHFDALDAAVQLTGRELGNRDTDSLGFALLQAASVNKQALLSELTDSYWNMPWDSFKETCLEADFAPVLTFQYQTQHSEVEQVISAERTKKLLLVSYSHDGHLGSATLYGTINDSIHPVTSLQALLRAHSGWNPVGETQYAFYTDVREGLKLKLDIFEDAGLEFTDWLHGKESPLHQLGNYYREPKEQLADHEAWIRASLPQWVKDFTNL